MKNLFFVLLLLFGIIEGLYAHQTALSYLEIETNSDKTVQLHVKKPSQDIARDDLKIELPRRCVDILPQSNYHDSGFLITKRLLWCGEEGLSGSSIWLSNLRQSDKGVIFRYSGEDVKIENILLHADSPYVLISPDTKIEKSWDYFGLGIVHILKGSDHLLFVLALILIVSNLKLLIETITAFTLSHSFTLGVASLGLVKFNVLYIEMMIALSIIFLARELLSPDKERHLTYRYPWVVALFFGLLHGLGFASALVEVGLPQEDIIASLLYFNLGVEFGQLLFISMVYMVIGLYSYFTSKYHDRFKVITAYIIGIVSAYWFIERYLLLF